MTEQFLTIKDVMQILNLTYRQVNTGMISGRIPGVRLAIGNSKYRAGQWIVLKGELRRWMDEKGMARDIDYVL
jgi:hypothetical protein